MKAPANKESRSKGTKDRKGGKKSRKLGPERRLERTMRKFTGTSNELTFHKKVEEGAVKNMVHEGIMEPLSGREFKERLNRPRHLQVNPKKIAKLLCPNGY